MKNKLIVISYSVMIVASTALPSRGATMCEGTSAPVSLDLVTGVRTAVTSETICYSTSWVDGAASDATAVIEVNGEVLNSVSGSGYVDWTPMSNGIYVLAHKVMSGSEQIGDTLTATFVAEGRNPQTPIFSPANGTIFDTSLTVSIAFVSTARLRSRRLPKSMEC